jgi:ribulose-phosphate 3-epimerase
MTVICPTITATTTPSEYELQMDRLAGFAERIQIDLADGEFASPKTTNPIQTWWPRDIDADIHLMFEHPHEHVETLISLKPSLVIIHAEAKGNLVALVDHLKKFEIKTGVALLAPTTVESCRDIIERVDHVLLFSGDLGRVGGKADLTLLAKVDEIRAINPGVEIGWDGGANESNVVALARGGIDVINVGGAIQRSDDAEKAYDTLVSKLHNEKENLA